MAHLRRRTLTRHAVATAASVGAVGAVTVAVYALDPAVPVLSLGVLYLFAVLPVAALWGLAYAVGTSIVSMLVFNWLFLPPTHTFALADSENWAALAVYLVTAVTVSGLAARARRRATEAEQGRREAAFAADAARSLLARQELEPQLAEIASRAAELLGASGSRIELGPGTEGHPLVADDRELGRLVLPAGVHPEPQLLGRILSVTATLLGTAADRAELARDVRESEAVLRSVSHDLRSPITAIMTASEVLEAGLLTDDERDELLHSIRLQVRRLDRLFANLLDLSRLEAGAARPVPELWTMDGLVSRSLEAIDDGAERIHVTVAPDSPPVRVDPSQFDHALVNVLENALKFSSPDDPVEVHVEHRGGRAVLRVIDHGPGIPPDELERIFEPFNRGGRADGERGSGLGLAIARGFVQLNGGTLRAEAAPGAGATLVLEFPAVELFAGVRA